MPQIDAIDVAVDAVGFLRRIELRLVFGEDLAALGEAVVVHEDVEIVPDRLGEFGLRIHQVHDAQIGLEACGEALEILLGDVAPCGIRPHRGDAVSKFAAASRIAEAVISGWPEAPSSPLQGGALPAGPGAACGAGPDFGPGRCCPESS